ncbi:hypothetical protein UY3_00408 [Chelonia mydas]|uniref:Uncharacterized protein n=1 Tax=Chelonia mydas TaxID=8469 RepID=M7C2F8_CHEMY|nr:hypothetical protein UY3_00408 [Chelonia mydas]
MAAQGRSSAVVAKARMNICKADDVRKDTEMMMKPYANWEEYLMPGPISIAILGELACIAAGQGDFSINKTPPVHDFKYIRHPDSFLASLTQVSHAGWHAFNIAHKNMDQIRLLSMSVPSHMKTIVQTLFQDFEVVNALLPGQLNNMKSIADDCTRLAQSVEIKFTDVICLIQELLEACLSSKMRYEEELRETKMALEHAELKRKAAEEAKEMAKEYYNSMRNQVENTFADYKEAMDSVPTGWNAVGMNVAESLLNGLNTVPHVIKSFTSALTKPNPERLNSSEAVANKKTEDDPISVSNICSMSEQLTALATALEELIDNEGNINMNAPSNEKALKEKSSWIKERAEQLQRKIKEENYCSVTDGALGICSILITVCQTLNDGARSGKKDIDKKSLIEKIRNLSDKVNVFDSKSKSHTKTPTFSAKTPNTTKCQQNSEMVTEWGTIKNSCLKIEQSREMLKITQNVYQRTFENFKKPNMELTEILITMRKCKTKEIDFETARKMLIKGLEALGRVKEQWEKMVHFFQMMSNLIESCLSRRIVEFVKSAEGVQKIPNCSCKSFVTDLIYKQAFNASNVAHLVHMISETYTEVSSKYLMNCVSSLVKLISMEPSNPSFKDEREKLANGCDEARKAIEDLVVKKKNEFERNLHGRVEKISHELNSVLPPVTEEEQKAIRDCAAGDEGAGAGGRSVCIEGHLSQPLLLSRPQKSGVHS